MTNDTTPGTRTLIAAARGGDGDAFEQLLTRYRGFIFGALRRRGIDDTGLKTSDDLFQSVAFLLWRGLTGPDDVSTKERRFFDSATDADSFRRLLGRVVLCRCLKSFQYETAEKRRGTVGLDASGTLASRAPDPAEDALSGLTVDEIREELGRLIPNGAAVFDDYVNDVSVAESAHRNGVSERTLERSRTMVRRYLEERFARDFSAVRRDEPTSEEKP